MNNTDNPFLGIAEIMNKSGTVNGFSFCIGKVVSVSPLVVEGNNLSFSGDDLYINDYLLPGITRTVSLTCNNVNGSTSCSKRSGKLESLNVPNGTLTMLNPRIMPGSKVLLLISDDKQTVIVTCILRRG